jgi:hypothetical protein
MECDKFQNKLSQGSEQKAGTSQGTGLRRCKNRLGEVGTRLLMVSGPQA